MHNACALGEGRGKISFVTSGDFVWEMVVVNVWKDDRRRKVYCCVVAAVVDHEDFSGIHVG